jgi:NDP-sugar pyrophosphorylase family protein
MSDPKRAVVLAGGTGSRLRPYTVCYPKPMMPVGRYPVLEIIIRQLQRNGFLHITIAVNHLADMIKAFFGTGEQWGVKIDYSIEHEPLGTMGPLLLVPDLPENFLVMNGDILTDFDYSSFFSHHCEAGQLFTIGSSMRREKVDYGVLETSTDGKLTGFREKPDINYLVSMGVYAVNRRVLCYISTGKPFGFDHLMLNLLAEKEKVDTVIHDGLWLDIGRPSDYQVACEQSELWETRLPGGGHV